MIHPTSWRCAGLATLRQKTEKMCDKLPRRCKDCSAPIAKGKQLCEPCRLTNWKARRRIARYAKSNRAKGILPAWEANFKCDANGNVIEKICTTCKQWKTSDQFTKRNDTASGLRSFCKPCDNEYHKKYEPKPTEPRQIECARCGVGFIAIGRRKYCGDECAAASLLDSQRIKNNSIHFLDKARCKQCNETKPLSDFLKKEASSFGRRPTTCRSCGDKSAKTRRKKDQKKRRKDPKHKIRYNLSRRFHALMKTVKKGGAHSLSTLLGCTTTHLRKHIESQFKRGQRWDNYGTKWHIDHILPVASFNHNNPEQVKRCWHYSNLRPLCATKNVEKSDSIINCQPELLINLHTSKETQCA